MRLIQCLISLLSLGWLSAVCADVDPRSYIDPNLQVAVVMGSNAYYDNYFDANGNITTNPPATLQCFAKRNIKALNDAISKCNRDVGDARDSSAKFSGYAQAAGALKDSADTVSDAVDVVGQLGDKAKEVMDRTGAFAGDQAARNARQNNQKRADKWGKRQKSCKSASGKVKRLLGKVNLAKETADWVSWICECTQGFCNDWENDVLVEIEDTTGACKELETARGQWNELADQTEGPEQDCEQQE